MPDEAARRRRSAVRDRYLARLDEHAEWAIDEYMRRVPHFAQMSRPQKDAQLESAKWGAVWGLRMWVDGEVGLTADEADYLRRLAVRRVKEGRPLEVLVATWVSGFRSLCHLVETVADDLLEPSDAADLAVMSVAAVDAYAQVVETAYHAAQEQLARDAEGARKQFLADILRGWPASDELLSRSAERAGVRLPPDSTMVTLAVARSPLRAPHADEVAGVLEAARQAHRDGHPLEGEGTALTARDRSTAVVVVATDPAVTIAQVAAREGWYAALIPVADWSGCAAAHRRACFALRVAPERAFAEHRHLNDIDVGVLALLHGEPVGRAEAVPREILGGLLAPQHEVLLETLEAYLATSSLRETADRLGIHEQTLRYRIRQIQELTGRDLHSPWDGFVLRLGSAAGSAAGSGAPRAEGHVRQG